MKKIPLPLIVIAVGIFLAPEAYLLIATAHAQAASPAAGAIAPNVQEQNDLNADLKIVANMEAQIGVALAANKTSVPLQQELVRWETLRVQMQAQLQAVSP